SECKLQGPWQDSQPASSPFLPCAMSRAWSAVLKLRQISSWHCSHSVEPIYFAPGTSGSTTAWRLMLLQEIAATSRTTAPAASARFRPCLPRGGGCLMNGSSVMRIVCYRSFHALKNAPVLLVQFLLDQGLGRV